MNLDTFTGHLKLSDSYRKALTFIVYPLIAALSLCLGFFYYCAFKASAIGLPGLWLSALPLIACLFVGVLLLIKEQHNPAICFVVIGVPAVTAFGLFMLPRRPPYCLVTAMALMLSLASNWVSFLHRTQIILMQ